MKLYKINRVLKYSHVLTIELFTYVHNVKDSYSTFYKQEYTRGYYFGMLGVRII